MRREKQEKRHQNQPPPFNNDFDRLVLYFDNHKVKYRVRYSHFPIERKNGGTLVITFHSSDKITRGHCYVFNKQWKLIGISNGFDFIDVQIDQILSKITTND